MNRVLPASYTDLAIKSGLGLSRICILILFLMDLFVKVTFLSVVIKC